MGRLAPPFIVWRWWGFLRLSSWRIELVIPAVSLRLVCSVIIDFRTVLMVFCNFEKMD